MRGLNLIKREWAGNLWALHQQRCIDHEKNKVASSSLIDSALVCEALFPGSYLLNQIAVHEGNYGCISKDSYFSAASFDPVYESLSIHRKAIQKNGILLDLVAIEKRVEQKLYDRVFELVQENGNLDTLLLWDRRQLKTVSEIFKSMQLKVQCIDPDWKRAAELISVYRNVSHSIFVNSARVADAAYCGYSSTLIADDTFVSALHTDALWVLLKPLADCTVIVDDEYREQTNAASTQVSENRLVDFQRALSGQQSGDWLDEYRTMAELNEPVIEACAGKFSRSMENVVDFRIKLRRKARKLREDPKRFCCDSNNRVLNSIGKVIPASDSA